MRPRVIGFDFDDTLFMMGPNYAIGEPIHANIEVLKRLFDEGNVIIIWSGRKADEINKHLQGFNIPCHRINNMELIKVDIPKTPSGKPNWDVFVDDKNVNPQEHESGAGLYDRILQTIELQDRLHALRGGDANTGKG